jgi:hypothetical protein
VRMTREEAYLDEASSRYAPEVGDGGRSPLSRSRTQTQVIDKIRRHCGVYLGVIALRTSSRGDLGPLAR